MVLAVQPEVLEALVVVGLDLVLLVLVEWLVLLVLVVVAAVVVLPGLELVVPV